MFQSVCRIGDSLLSLLCFYDFVLSRFFLITQLMIMANFWKKVLIFSKDLTHGGKIFFRNNASKKKYPMFHRLFGLECWGWKSIFSKAEIYILNIIFFHHKKQYFTMLIILGTKQWSLCKEKNLGKKYSSQRKGCKESKEKYCQ